MESLARRQLQQSCYPSIEDLQLCLNDKDITQEIFRNLKRAILQKQFWKISVVEPVLNNIAKRDSRLARTLKRSFHQGGFSVNTLELPGLLQ